MLTAMDLVGDTVTPTEGARDGNTGGAASIILSTETPTVWPEVAPTVWPEGAPTV